MPKLYSARDLIHRLKKFKFTIVSQKGSHIKLRGTLSSILKQANITKQELDAQ
jgi:predicted RNA binding protein YcfA (HicA-like mRNA interferase family)